jgi:hypothetical protein
MSIFHRKAMALEHRRCHVFDGCPEFRSGVTSCLPAPQLCRNCPDQPLRSGTTGSFTGRTSAQRVAAVGRHDRGSVRYLARIAIGRAEDQVSGQLGGPRRGLSGRVSPKEP